VFILSGQNFATESLVCLAYGMLREASLLPDVFEADEFEVFAFEAPVRCLWFWGCVLGGAGIADVLGGA
jgi:hypothetical protein